jgi:sensor histidine kinase YesM
MSLAFARNAPMSVQVFCWAFLVRPPLQDEVPELQALLATLRKRRRWLAGIYLAFLAVLVLPGVLRERGADYTIAAVTLPHILLLLMLSLSLNMWAGFRVNLGNFGKVYLQNRRRWSAMISIAVLFAMGFFAGLFGGDVQDRVRVTTRAWLDDTLTPAAVGFLLVVLVLALPELVARMRQQHHALSLRLAEAQTAQERLARVTAESELRLLQAQVEPHFLYNTLANLRFLVQTGSPDALRMTDALIDYLQTSVPDMRAQQVTLGREADHARHYLEIMRMRMGGRLQYAIDVPLALRDFALPPLVLLTLVENAVKHGIAPLVQGGSIRLSAATQGDDVIVEVADDGAGIGTLAEGGSIQLGSTDEDSDLVVAIAGDGNEPMPGAPASAAARQGTRPPAAPGGTGLRNVAARLVLAYGERAELLLTNNTPRGTRAALRLPASGMSPDSAAVQIMVLAEEDSQAPTPPAATAAPDAPARPATQTS